MAEEQGKKRVASRQLTERDEVDDEVEAGDGGTWRKADASVMQTRKIFKVRSKSNLDRAAAEAEATPAAESPPSKPFSFADLAKEETKQEPKVAEEKSTNGTPSTPVKETTSPSKAPESSTPSKESEKEATPVKEKEATPVKEAKEEKEGTPVKEKEGTPVKEKEESKTESTPEAPKPTPSLFSLPSSFSFPTSFTSTPFSFPSLSSSTTPAFTSSSATPAFSGFNFPSVNFSAGGSSVFGAGASTAKKEGSDDEGDDNANPEEEVAITGPAKLPIVQTVTGEEDETTMFTVRAKLFAMIEGNWQERGVGQLKINKGQDGKCRLLMRDQGGKHLRLNTSLFPEMKIDKSGEKSVQFVAVGAGGAEGAAPTATKAFTTFALRVARKEEAEELYEALQKNKAPAATAST